MNGWEALVKVIAIVGFVFVVCVMVAGWPWKKD